MSLLWLAFGLPSLAEQPSPVLEAPLEIHVKTDGTPACFTMNLRNGGRAVYTYQCRANCPTAYWRVESKSVEVQRDACWGSTEPSECTLAPGKSKSYDVCVKIRKGRPSSDGVTLHFEPPGTRTKLSKRIPIILEN